MNFIDMDSAVLGARFCDGGHLVNGENAERIRLDPPIVAPEESDDWPQLVLVVFGAAGFAVLGLAYFWGLARLWGWP